MCTRVIIPLASHSGSISASPSPSSSTAVGGGGGGCGTRNGGAPTYASDDSPSPHEPSPPRPVMSPPSSSIAPRHGPAPKPITSPTPLTTSVERPPACADRTPPFNNPPSSAAGNGSWPGRSIVWPPCPIVCRPIVHTRSGSSTSRSSLASTPSDVSCRGAPTAFPPPSPPEEGPAPGVSPEYGVSAVDDADARRLPLSSLPTCVRFRWAIASATSVGSRSDERSPSSSSTVKRAAADSGSWNWIDAGSTASFAASFWMSACVSGVRSLPNFSAFENVSVLERESVCVLPRESAAAVPARLSEESVPPRESEKSGWRCCDASSRCCAGVRCVVRVHGAADDADGAVGDGDAGDGDGGCCGGAVSWLLRLEIEPRIKERMVAALAKLRSRDRRWSSAESDCTVEFRRPTRKSWRCHLANLQLRPRRR